MNNDLNFSTDFREIVEGAARQVEELAELRLRGFSVNELKDEGSSGADFVAAGEEITADQGFKDAGLAAALAADHCNLREVHRRLASDATEDVL